MNYYKRTQRAKKKPLHRYSLTNVIIGINVVVFLLIWVALLAGYSQIVVDYFALKPSLFFQGIIWTLLTSMFMHASFLHLFVNMVSMFFIGNFVEQIIGRKRFMWFYLISGLIAGLFFVFFAYLGQFLPGGEKIFGGYEIAALGASGALFGIGGLLAVLIPRLKVLVFFVIPMPLWLAMVVLMFGLWAFSIIGNLPVGNTAHFGGLVAGVIYGIYLRVKYHKKVKMLNRMFI